MWWIIVITVIVFIVIVITLKKALSEPTIVEEQTGDIEESQRGFDSNVTANIDKSHDSELNTDTGVDIDEMDFHEKILKIVAIVILVAGVVGFFSIMINGWYISYPGGEVVFNLRNCISSFVLLLSSVGSWALMRVVGNISATLRKRDRKE